MNKKILGSVIAGIVIVVGIAAYGLTLEPENGSTIRNDKLGLVINPPTTSPTLQSLEKIYSEASSTGIGRSNMYMFWSVIEPEKGAYNWDQFDILMSLNKQNDLKVTLFFSIINGKTLGPFPNWIGNPDLISISVDELSETLDAVLTRYDIVDTVIISGETDAHFRYKENDIPVYTEIFQGVYDSLKEKHPNVQFGNAFSLHGVLNKNLEHIVKELGLGDFVAFSYFPVDSLNEIVKTPQEALADLEKIYEIVPNKKIGIFEISWSTSDFVGGTQEDQAVFVETVFNFYQSHSSSIEFLTWYRQYDRPEDTCYIDPQSVEGDITIGGSEHVIERLSNYICNAGLIDIEGNPKSGWSEFKDQVRINTNS